MPASDTLEFNCPSCQVSLLVPKSHAGISGPCPHCEASITSPSPIPAPLRKKQEPPVARTALPPKQEKTPIPPQRKQTIPEKTPNDLSDDQKWSEDEETKKSSGCWPALLFLLFLTVAAYFVLSFLGLVPNWRTIPSKLFPKAHRIEQAPSPRTTKEPQVIESTSSGKVTSPPDPIPEKPSKDPDPFTDETANTPRECLKRFLAAKTLDQRLAFMTSSSLSENELRQSLLSGSFPDSHPPQVETKLALPDSSQSESYYTVTFKTPLKDDISVITVKVLTSPGTHSPKVDTIFFLDLLQSVVVDINQNISPEPLEFQAIIEASAYCFDDIPNSDTMAKLMFFRNMDAKASPLATAYLPKNSPIFQGIKKHNAPGSRIPGTITVKWNQSLDPAKPFLEVIALKSSALK